MKKRTNAEVNAFIKANYQNKTYLALGKMLGLSEHAVRGRVRRMGLKKEEISYEIPDAEAIAQDMLDIKTKQNKKDISKKYNFLLNENELLKKQLEVSRNPREYDLSPIKNGDSKDKTEATAVLLLSDWHVEQKVEQRKIGYPNEYNLEIAKSRSEELFKAAVKFLKKEKTHYEIDTLVCALLGDFITGNIHLSALPMLQLGVVEACFYAEELLIRGIQYLLDNTDVKIVCPAICGNHARITEKIWIGSETDNSVETFIYQRIKQHFSANPRVEVIMPYGSEIVMNIYGKKYMFAHGHAGYRYKGGIGGLYIPVRRSIMTRYNREQISSVFMGHFHTFISDPMFLVNGSMIGFDDFANFLKLAPEDPCQVFFLIDKKFGKRTMTVPISFKI